MITEEQIENVLCDFGEGDILLLQNEINSIDYIIAAAHKKGMIVILNPSPIDERVLTLDYSMIDYLILNEIEAKDITGAQDYENALSIFREKHPHIRIMLTFG